MVRRRMHDGLTIEIAGRLFEDATELKKRLATGEGAIESLLKQGMPAPIKVGRKRYFDRDEIDRWLLDQVVRGK